MEQEINKLISDIRTEFEAKKGSDSLVEQKLNKMEADLAKAISAFESKSATPNIFGGKASNELEVKAALKNFIRGDVMAVKAFNELSPSTGGVFLPKDLQNDIVTQARNASGIRKIARVVSGKPGTYALPVIKGGKASVLGVADARTETTQGIVSNVTPPQGVILAYGLATNSMLEDSQYDLINLLMSDWISQIQEEEAFFVTGDGVNKPTGFLHASAGVGTVKTGVAASFGANAFDNLADLRYSLKSQFAVNGKWVMNSFTLATLAKVKDSNGRYLLETSTSRDAQTIFNKEIVIDEAMPNVGAGVKPVAFGDFDKGYVIVDNEAGISIKLDTITQPGFTKVIIEHRVAGAVRDSDAIKALVCAV